MDLNENLKRKTVSELEMLNSNEEEATFIDLMDGLPEVKDIKSKREMLERNNLTLAKELSDYEPRFESSRQQLIDSNEKYGNIREEFDTNIGLLTSIIAGTNVEEILPKMQSLANQSETDSEDTVETFLSGTCDLASFITEFLQQRAMAHIRRVKAEQMSKLLRKPHRQSARSHSSSHLPYPAHPYPGQANAPRVQMSGMPPAYSSNHW